MFNDLNKCEKENEEMDILVPKASAISEDGIRGLFEAQSYRESRLAEEKNNSSLLSSALEKLIKVLVPTK